MCRPNRPRIVTGRDLSLKRILKSVGGRALRNTFVELNFCLEVAKRKQKENVGKYCVNLGFRADPF